MILEVCSSYNDDEMYTQQVEFPIPTTWNHHLIGPKVGRDLSHFINAYSTGRWDGIKNQVKPMGAKAELTLEVRWGDKEGPTFTASGSASVNDDKGNYAEIIASQDSNGQGSAEITVGHEEEGDNNK